MILDEIEPCQLIMTPSGAIVKLHFRVDECWAGSYVGMTDEDAQLYLSDEFIRYRCTLL